MARVDLGEFGRVETTAVIDTIGVDPDYQNKGVGRALVSQLLTNLGTLRVERCAPKSIGRTTICLPTSTATGSCRRSSSASTSRSADGAGQYI